MSEEVKEQYYTIKELADSDWFPYKSQQIRRFIKSERLKTTAISKQRIYIHKASVDEFLKGLKL